MRESSFIPRFLVCFGLMAPCLTPEPVDDAKPIASRITAVTVYADRGQVTRVSDLELAEGVARVAFTQLPGWMDESSLRVQVSPVEAAQVLDVQVARQYLARVEDEAFRKAESALREISDKLAGLDDERGVLAAQEKQLETLRLFAFDKLPRDMAVREVKAAEYGETLKYFASRQRELAAEKRQLEVRKRDMAPELAACQKRLDELRARSQLEQRSVVVTLSGTGKKFALSLVYFLPGATWEPGHELRTGREGGAVTLSSHATVRQTTGEDWSACALSLGTQRTSATMRIPELESLLLGSGPRVGRVAESAKESFGAAKMQFAAQNMAWFQSRNANTEQQDEYRANQEAMAKKSREAESRFETLQSRGTTALFPAQGNQTVRFDGRPVRLPLGKLELSAQARILAAPELSVNAARVVDLTLTGKLPLLPGRVSLYLDGAFLGYTETDFVAPGETFSLYLGVADEIKISRVLDRKRSELRRSGARTRVTASYLVAVENLSEAPKNLQLSERIPVSENEAIKVSGVKITPELKPDNKGLLRWDLALAGKQAREIRIEYAIEYPTDMPERLRDEKGDDAVPARKLREQIKTLENDLK